MIVIKNLRIEHLSYPYQVDCSRKSVLGNPFHMTDETMRDDVCDKYENWFNINYRKEPYISRLREMYKIHKQYGNLELFCWCSPKRCHTETIKRFLDQYV